MLTFSALSHVIVSILFSDSEDGGVENALPPGVSQEDVDLFKQAQDRAQDLLTKVCATVQGQTGNYCQIF